METLWKTSWKGCNKALQTSFFTTGIYSVITVCLASYHFLDRHSCLVFFSAVLIIDLLTQAKKHFFSLIKQNLTPLC
ncbi:MAG: hypothetical protein RL571_899 [Pseudomonadota bacterium]|jgi:hypothetical protein